MKTCTKCAECKPLEDFHRTPKRSDGRRSDCKACVSERVKAKKALDPDKYRDMERRWRAANPEKVRATAARFRARHIDRRREYEAEKRYFYCYKMTPADRDAMLAAQGGVCALCGTDEPRGKGWSIDHDHACCPGPRTCGDCIRGILCHACNTSLGGFKDDPMLLQRAIEYVQQHTEKEKVA